MTRLIDADELTELLNWTFTKPPFSRKTVQKMIDMARTIDAVPVVRCCDCKYYEEQDETIGTCLLTESGAHIKGYCSWAEVKE